MNKKLPDFFRPSIGLYLMILIVFAVTTFFFGEHSHALAGIQIVIIVFLLMYTIVAGRSRARRLASYLESVTDGVDSAIKETPLPVAIFSFGTNRILWSNERFLALTGGRERFFGVSVKDAIPGFSAQWLMDGKTECPENVTVGEQKYRVFGSLARTERDFGTYDYVATTYWIDVTESAKIADDFKDSRPVIAIIMLDNYDELLKGLSEKEKSVLLSDVDEKITAWASGCEGYLCKYDRDRYFLIFEAKYLEHFVTERFSVLDAVRVNIGAGGVHATLSIGLGKDGNTPAEAYVFANLASEMALSRGGDQAVIKNRFGFDFYGGYSAQLEKRTKVKSRVMASAFGGLVNDCSTLFVMGHKNADLDSIGAAIGIVCIARSRGKPAYIVVDPDNNFSQSLIARAKQADEYKNVFITQQDAIIAADSKSLLVVVDTSRPEKVESETLLLSCNRVAVIDHHRRAATYIDNAVLNFHEPYASSACELVTEMIQYLIDGGAILRIEAEALLSGIVLDTKSFAIHTGSRTFDAAAFLRRAGADTVDVKRLLQSDFETAISRYTVIKSAVMYKEGIAIASSGEVKSRIVIAQAADELLNIAGVRASFVLSTDQGDVFVSGRSIGTVNVQVILEKLGGGGNQSTAGGQIKGKSLEEALGLLKNAIDEYFNDLGGEQ